MIKKKHLRNFIIVFIIGIVMLLIPKVNALEEKAIVWIDSPDASTTSSKTMLIRGWTLSDEEKKIVEVYVDNEKINNVTYETRKDVLKAYPKYNKNLNQNNGYKVTFDNTKLLSGTHTLTVKLLNSDTKAILGEQTKKIVIKKYDTRIQIDDPAVTINKNSKMKIRGWVMSETINKRIEVYVDNVKINNVTSEARSDVLKAITGYGGKTTNKTPGYVAYFDATSLSYGKHTVTIKVINNVNQEILLQQSKTFNLLHNTKIQIDDPSTTISKSSKIKIRGWVMSETINKRIEVYVDNVKINNVASEARSDVLKAITGYGGKTTNKTPGYVAYFDGTTFKTGSHTVTIKVFDSSTNELLSESTKKFNIKKYDTRIQIDDPAVNVKKSTKMKIRGWVMSEAPNRVIDIYVDNIKVSSVTSEARSDVLKAITGYGGKTTNKTPGYVAYFDNTTIKSGSHKITVNVVDTKTNEILLSQTKTFNVKKYDTKIQIDDPTGNVKKSTKMKIRGWVMSEAPNRVIDIYVDNIKVSSVTSEARSDVLKAITGYGGKTTNQTPGYVAYFDNTTIKSGSHKITVNVVDPKTNETLLSQTKTFNVKKYNTRIQIDDPSTNTKGTEMKIRGWVMSEAENKIIDIYVDNIKVSDITNEARSDVLKAILDYGGTATNKNPGYLAYYNVENLKDGSHTVKVVVLDQKAGNEVIAQATKTITLKKYDGIIMIDNPVNTNVTGNLYVRGWEMSELDNSYVQIYIDNKLMNVTINKEEREDVLSKIVSYGGRNTNTTPGFNATINLNSISTGIHTLKIKLFTKRKEQINETQKEIFVYKNVSVGIDVSKYQGSINWTNVKKDGIRFAFVRSSYRGYGTGALVEDPLFKVNVNNAYASGIKVGVYVFSQAINEKEAKEEADYIINQLWSYQLTKKVNLPIVMDQEFGNSNHTGRADQLTKKERTKIVRAFINEIKSKGFTPMIYASKSFLYNNLDMSQLSDAQVWLAHYTTNSNPMNFQSDYTGKYQVWQYTSEGRVSGINGDVDMDISYSNY